MLFFLVIEKKQFHLYDRAPSGTIELSLVSFNETKNVIEFSLLSQKSKER